MKSIPRSKCCSWQDLWVSVIVALIALVAVATTYTDIENRQIAGDVVKEEGGVETKLTGDWSDGSNDEQYFIYYNPYAQERTGQIESVEQGCSSKMFEFAIFNILTTPKLEFCQIFSISRHH